MGELPQYLEERFRGYTLKGNWLKVMELYKFDVKFCTTNINESKGTALHVAVNQGNESVVSSLVDSILLHGNMEAFKMKNEKGDTPLHLAASRGFKEIYLAIIVIDKFPVLGEIPNVEGYTPLKLLATRPSAFKSGCKMILWKKILYYSLKSEDAKKYETLKSETPILTAARYGIVEMVNVLMNEIPSSIYETNLENKNILLVAIENKRTIVVESLKKWFLKRYENQIFDDLIQWVDNEDNTVLHLAARQSYQDWNTSGAALEMMWHIKWFQYTKGLVPEHFTIRTNKMNQTAEEMFKKSYAPQVEEGSKWLKETSQSCSVVAALLAGVSFATSSTVPGGNKSDTGEPALEGKPAFDAFALSSAIGLCFSVTALIMFLSILTSRKKVKDFRIDLPRKLLCGLSSLFFSIVAMFTAFCSGNFFLIDKKYKHIEFLIYPIICFPVTLYAVLYIDLLIGIVTKIPMTSVEGEDL
ncbi:uncharacterized protein [Cicer arietinum]|uniref:uncharacterized protein n=1 Tax=Cicer arietinum TaxID=3827 RepID=UPI003CC6A407